MINFVKQSWNEYISYYCKFTKREFMKKLVFATIIMAAVTSYSLAATGKQYVDQARQAANNGNFVQAAKFFKKACDGGNAKGCYNLGFLYKNGQGVRQSYANAKEYYGKACDMGLEQGCSNYADLNKKAIKR